MLENNHIYLKRIRKISIHSDLKIYFFIEFRDREMETSMIRENPPECPTLGIEPGCQH